MPWVRLWRLRPPLTPLKKGGDEGPSSLFQRGSASGISVPLGQHGQRCQVSGLTLALAAELAPRIRVNALAPSLTRTPLSEWLLTNPEAAEALAAQHALKRLGTPKDVVRLAVFLLSSRPPATIETPPGELTLWVCRAA